MSESTLDLGTELDKVKNVLGALWAKIPHTSEEEAKGVADLIDAIGVQAGSRGWHPQTEIPAEDTVVDPLAGMTTEELQAELAKRTTPVGLGS